MASPLMHAMNVLLPVHDVNESETNESASFSISCHATQVPVLDATLMIMVLFKTWFSAFTRIPMPFTFLMRKTCTPHPSTTVPKHESALYES